MVVKGPSSTSLRNMHQETSGSTRTFSGHDQPPAARRILVVEDEGIVARDIQTTLETLGYEVTAVVSSGEAAIKAAVSTRLDLVLMDIVLKGGMDGVETAEIIYSEHNIPVVYLTAYADDHTLRRAKTTTPFGYILKPFDERELQTAIEIALYRHDMEKRLQESKAELRHQLAIENTLATISAKFINLASEEIDAGINHALKIIGRFTKVDRNHLCSVSADGSTLVTTHEWCADGVASVITNEGVCLCNFASLEKSLKAHHIFYIPSLQSFHPEDLREKEFLQRKGIKSLIVVPMVCRGQLMGCVCLDSITSEKTWKENDITLLKMLAETFANTLDRKRVDEQVAFMNMQLEQRVAERTLQLETANRELESFCYSVSHDLRAPLRHINGFSQTLLSEYASQLDDKGKDYLHRVCAASSRMGHLIDDLLELSRVARSEMKCEQVNLTERAQKIADMLKETTPARNVIFSITPGLIVNGDVTLLDLLLQNLLDNAWKYTSKTGAATIELGVTGHNDAPVFFVRDNGVGFDMTYAGKLFGAFQRLHGSGEFEGTGIGLATAKRIISRHGGSIWGEGEVGKGATFYFTFARPGITSLKELSVATMV